MYEAKFSQSEDGKVLTVEREFDAPLNRIWDAHTQSELLEQWWAPLPWKAVTKKFDFREGGYWHYYMSGPDGERHDAGLDYHGIETGKSFYADDYFANEEGEKDTALPGTQWKVEFSDRDGKTKLVSTITFASAEDLEKLTAMGMKEGYAMGLDQLEQLVIK